MQSNDVTIIERSTYNFLEWLGDVGGLFDAVVIVGGVFIAPIATIALKIELLTEVFRKVLPAPAPTDLGAHMLSYFSNRDKITWLCKKKWR